MRLLLLSLLLLLLLLVLPTLLRMERGDLVLSLEAHGHGDRLARNVPDGGGRLDVGRTRGLEMVSLGRGGCGHGTRLVVGSTGEAGPDALHAVTPEM